MFSGYPQIQYLAKMTLNLNSLSPCPYFPGRRITGMYHHALFILYRGSDPEPPACKTSTLPTELYPQLVLENNKFNQIWQG